MTTGRDKPPLERLSLDQHGGDNMLCPSVVCAM